MKRFGAALIALLISISAWSQILVSQLPANFKPGGGFSDDGHFMLGDLISNGHFFLARSAESSGSWFATQITGFDGAVPLNCNSDASVFSGFLENYTGLTNDGFFWTAPLNVQLVNFSSFGTSTLSVSGNGAVFGGNYTTQVGSLQYPLWYVYFVGSGTVFSPPVPAGYDTVQIVGGQGSFVTDHYNNQSIDAAGDLFVGQASQFSGQSALCWYGNGSPYWAGGSHTYQVPGTTSTSGLGCSEDGSTFYGVYNAPSSSGAFTLNYSAGLSEYPNAIPVEISENGLVLAMNESGFGMIHNPTVGAQGFIQFLQSYGYHGLDSATETYINAMSADGTAFDVSYTINNISHEEIIQVPAYQISVQDESYPVVAGQSISSGPPGILATTASPYPDFLVQLSNPTHAQTFNLGTDGSFSYQPVTGFVGQDSFQYTARLVAGGNPPANNGVVTFNVLPVLNSVTPKPVVSGGPTFSLTANGNYYTPGSVVCWNGTPLSTSFGSSTQLIATVPAGDIASSGTASITVVQNGETSLPQTLTIAQQNLGVNVVERLGMGPVPDGTVVKVLNDDGTALSTPTSTTTTSGEALFATIPLPTAPNSAYEVVVSPPPGAKGASAVVHGVTLGSTVTVYYTPIRPLVVQDLSYVSPVAYASFSVSGVSASTGTDGQTPSVFLPDGTYTARMSMTPGIPVSCSLTLGSTCSSNLVAESGYAQVKFHLTRVSLTARKASGATYIPVSGIWGAGSFSEAVNGQAVSPAFWIPLGTFTASLSGSGLNGSTSITLSGPVSNPVFSVPVQ